MSNTCPICNNDSGLLAQGVCIRCLLEFYEASGVTVSTPKCPTCGKKYCVHHVFSSEYETEHGYVVFPPEIELKVRLRLL